MFLTTVINDALQLSLRRSRGSGVPARSRAVLGAAKSSAPRHSSLTRCPSPLKHPEPPKPNRTCQRRANAKKQRAGAQAGEGGGGGGGASGADRRLVLTLDDVSEALREQGVNARQPPYFVG